MFKWLCPKKLLELNIQDYVSYMSNFIKVIFCIFFFLLLSFLTTFAYAHISGQVNLLGSIMTFYRTILGFSIVLTLLMLFIQSCITRKHKQSEFDMHKFHKALELIYNWSKDSTPEMLLARKIVDRLKMEEMKKLVDGNETIRITNKDYEMLSSFLPKDIKKSDEHPVSNLKRKFKSLKQKSQCSKRPPKSSKKKSQCQFINECEAANIHTLSMSETLWLRSWIVKYLNILEVIMYAWKLNVVDRKTIENQFGYLVKAERDGSVVLEDFRKIFGQENYPGIYSFCEYMSKENKKKIIEQNIGG